MDVTDSQKDLRVGKMKYFLEAVEYLDEKNASISTFLTEVPWVTEDGKSVYVYDMDTNHLINARNMLLKSTLDGPLPKLHDKYVKMFEYELGKRYNKTKDPIIMGELL